MLKKIDTLIYVINQSSVYVLTSNEQLQSCHFTYHLTRRVSGFCFPQAFYMINHCLKVELEANIHVFFIGCTIERIPLHCIIR
jgi:hypothetical protein